MCAAQAGTNLMYGAGMLDSGLIFSYAQLIIDNDIFKMVRKVLQGIVIDDEHLALEAIKAVGPGGDHLMQEHTMKYMRTLPSAPNLIERGNYERWLKSGGKDFAQRAAERASELLASHKPLPLEETVVSTLRSIVEEADSESKIMEKEG